ncbi:hypothetical protein D3C81_852930 [compost metagenome]
MYSPNRGPELLTLLVPVTFTGEAARPNSVATWLIPLALQACTVSDVLPFLHLT